MKISKHPGYCLSRPLVVGVLLLTLSLTAFSDDQYDEPCPPCTEWDHYANDCIDIPNSPCWILATWGENAIYDTCFQSNTCIPQCGTIIETKSYICHKKECPGFFFYNHDYSDITYARIEQECSISYNSGVIAQDLIECGAVLVDCAASLTVLAASLPGCVTVGAPPDASYIASCLDGLGNCSSRDPCDYYQGCNICSPVLSEPKYKCTVSSPGCGDF